MAFTRRSLAALALVVALCSPARAAVQLFTFGDSFVDVGNADLDPNYKGAKADMLPYGSSLNPPRPTGRFGNGLIFPDFLADRLGIPRPPPFLQPEGNRTYGVNLAESGAGALGDTNMGPVNLPAQMDNFRTVVNCTNPNIIFNNRLGAIAVLSFGVNDYVQVIQKHPFKMLKAADKIPDVVNSISAAVRDLHQCGIRRFIVMGLGPMGCSPLLISKVPWSGGKCLEDPNTVAVQHNDALVAALGGLRTELRDSSVVYVDINKSLDFVSKTFNIPLDKGACCTNGDMLCGPADATVCNNTASYLFWDAIHPTQFTWGRMFGLAWRGDKDYVYPNNLETVTHIMRHSARKQLAMAHQEMAKAQKMASAFRQRLAAAQRLAGAQKH